jgi:polyisoprenoid-binding protein YceI
MLARTMGWLTLALVAVWPGGVEAQVRRFKVDAGSQVQFVSEAPLERFTGTSSGVSGEVRVDPSAPADARGAIFVAVKSIRTGIELRDEHLASDTWLDAARHPNIVFELTGVTFASDLTPNAVVEPTVRGQLKVHGVAREVVTTARVRYVPASAPGERETLRVQASFVVHLKDHAVSIPSIVALKVSPDLRINVDLRASAEAPAPPAVVQAPTPAVPASEPAAEPAARVEPQQPASPTPRAPAATAAAKPAPAAKPAVSVSRSPSTARPTPAAPKAASAPAAPAAREPAPASPAAKPAVQVPPEEELKRLLRQAHYYLANDRPELAILSVQKAQKVLPLVEAKLRE